MDVSNPKRVLAVSLQAQAHLLGRAIEDLTGSAPTPAATSLAGTTHELALKTQYYTAAVPVWLDLVASPAEWAASFLSAEAAEVLAVLGGLVLVFGLPDAAASADEVRQLVGHVGRVVDQGLGGWEWDGVRLAVGVGEGEADEWDELCAEAGLEFVQVRPGRPAGVNEFGERTGMARVKEALEANDWAQAEGAALSDDDFDGGSSDGRPGDEVDFGFDRADFEGLKKAIWSAGQDDDDGGDGDGDAAPGAVPSAGAGGGSGTQHGEQADRSRDAKDGDDGGADDDDDVAKVESMMRRLQAARDAGAGMGEAQRRRMAARAVAEVMKDL